MTVLEESPPRPRLCHLVKRTDFQGYGFNLHAEKNKPGIQYIGMVDSNSPAQDAGLKEGDKIIEVNNVNIEHENHKQVVERIRSDSNQTRLLVVDKLTENYHKEEGIIITNSLEYVEYISSETRHIPHIQPIVKEEPDSRGSSPVSDASSNPSVRPDSRIRKDSVNSERTLSNRSSVSSRQEIGSISSGSPRSTPSPTDPSATEMIKPKPIDGLNLPMTAREMREMLSSRKKRDPRKDGGMDFRRKFDIIQAL
jgi:Na(+)/H(+) exchange regulatory cofactor NHE-RF2